MTCSVWTVDAAIEQTLFVYHDIYDSWSWIGGHADGEHDLASAALRELEEETGVAGARIVPCCGSDILSLETLTVDGHEKRGVYVSSHLHLNVTYLAVADPAEPLRCAGRKQRRGLDADGRSPGSLGRAVDARPHLSQDRRQAGRRTTRRIGRRPRAPRIRPLESKKPASYGTGLCIRAMYAPLLGSILLRGSLGGLDGLLSRSGSLFGSSLGGSGLGLLGVLGGTGGLLGGLRLALGLLLGLELGGGSSLGSLLGGLALGDGSGSGTELVSEALGRVRRCRSTSGCR